MLVSELNKIKNDGGRWQWAIDHAENDNLMIIAGDEATGTHVSVNSKWYPFDAHTVPTVSFFELLKKSGLKFEVITYESS